MKVLLPRTTQTTEVSCYNSFVCKLYREENIKSSYTVNMYKRTQHESNIWETHKKVYRRKRWTRKLIARGTNEKTFWWKLKILRKPLILKYYPRSLSNVDGGRWKCQGTDDIMQKIRDEVQRGEGLENDKGSIRSVLILLKGTKRKWNRVKTLFDLIFNIIPSSSDTYVWNISYFFVKRKKTEACRFPLWKFCRIHEILFESENS
jgi:hypothetical protein